MGGVGSGGKRDNGGRKVKLFFYVDGEEYTIQEASKEFRVKPIVIWYRLKRGLTGRDVVKTKLDKPKRRRLDRAIRAYKLVMQDFYTKSHRLECYKQLIKEMKEQRMKIAA